MYKRIKLIDGKEYTYISLDESREFFCFRCKKNKKSKKYAEYVEQGVKKVICNGCYGTICAGNK